jgi:MMP 1-O-methyltransferase
MHLDIDPDTVKGFLDAAEGERLYRLAAEACRLGPCLEIGSYCGKSTVWLGSACRAAGGILFAVDHHRGSEEHQPGEAYHDPALYDADIGAMDSLLDFRRTLRRARLDDVVVPIVAASALAARHWGTWLGMVFIDGGHSMAAAESDYRCWSPWVVPGGYLAIHDIFPDPAAGGRPPFEIYQTALASGLFEELPMTRTLGVLRRREQRSAAG